MAPPTRVIPNKAVGQFRKVASTEFGDDMNPVYGDTQRLNRVRDIMSGLGLSSEALVARATPPLDAPDTPRPMRAPLPGGLTDTGPELADSYPDPASNVPLPESRAANPNPTSTAAPATTEPDDAGDGFSDFPSLPTAEELEAIQRQAHDDGFAQGRVAGEKAGYAEGEARARAELQDQATLLHNLLTDLHARVAEQDQAVELELVDLAVTIATRVLQRELHTHPDHILASVRQGLAQLPSQQLSARILLHPDDLDALREHLVPEDPDQRWTLLADDALTRGSYRIEAGKAELSVDIQQRLEDAIDAVLDASGHAGHTGDAA